MDMCSQVSAATSFNCTVAAVIRLRRGILADPEPLLDARLPASFGCVRARYGTLFPRAMRMSDEAFNNLVIDLRPRLSKRGPTAALRVAMALRYLGGGSYVDACAVFGVPRATFYNNLWHVVDAMNSTPALEFRMPLGDGAWRTATARRFQLRGDSPFDNILGALDGIAVKQEQPADGDVPRVADHYCRKGFYALNVQAICDAEYRFLWMSCLSPGSVHDATAFASTGLGRRFALVSDSEVLQLVADGFCIAADEAYGASEVLAVPWSGGGGGDVWRDGYNFYQSSARMHIEQSFGLLVWRWGVFWRPLRVPFRKRPGLIRACFKLHNHCRRWDGEAVTSIAPFDKDSAGGSMVVEGNYNGAGGQRGRRRDCERSALRSRMTSRVELLGRRRPYTATLF